MDVIGKNAQTCFHWLRSDPNAPGALNLVGLTEPLQSCAPSGSTRACRPDRFWTMGSDGPGGLRHTGLARQRVQCQSLTWKRTSAATDVKTMKASGIVLEKLIHHTGCNWVRSLKMALVST